MMNNPQTMINVASGSCASFALTVSQIFLFLSGVEELHGGSLWEEFTSTTGGGSRT